ncbi:hypothetical protein [Pseudoxanthomonas sangjuensis]|uniref:hypothetical protein n=1 Tax=Pseudoxanthomonas sangjuensis TaxID=1503750 RepID=UPI0013918BAD|nr:hypothetical protein [Pseudoxanthomonas sangjuensis]
MSTIGVNVRDDKLAADCLGALVAFPVAIQHMRESNDAISIPNHMQAHTRDAFAAIDAAQQDCRMIAAAATDRLYRHIVELTVLDAFTRSYTAVAVKEFYSQLATRQVGTFYILDNSLRQDRFMAVLELLNIAGISCFSPNTHGTDWLPIERGIRQIASSHVAYIEPDATANHLAAAIALAKGLNSVATFRNEAPENPSISVINLPRANASDA